MVQGLVVRVVDGDTLDVSIDGRTYPVRLIGINTPETGGPYRDPECFGHEATEETRALVDGAQGRVYLERDVSDTDQYGRLLRYVWIDGPGGHRLLNELLVRDGAARVYTFPPDVRYRPRFQSAERDARDHGRGQWSACPAA
jgi:micrococcal nuclease